MPWKVSSLKVPADGKKPFTDYSRWRLDANDGGRHIWSYLSEEEAKSAPPQPIVDKFWLGQSVDLPDLPPAKDASEAARNGFEFLRHLQVDGGHWPGVYDGPMFLLPGLVIGSYITDMEFKIEERLEMIRYLINMAHPDDGGWGLHTEGVSTCFGTACNYVALRLLGAPADHPTCVKARAFLHKLGGATGVPAWGKFWLSVLNVYEWEGGNPVPPEFWLFPEWVPFHPHKWWIHTRNVYIPMSYLYALRYKAEEDDLIMSLRQELYVQDYNSIDWPAQRNNVCPVDIYAPHHPILNLANSVLSIYESCPFPPIRRPAMEQVYKLIVQEDENTTYQTLGPVSKMINLICRFVVEGKESESYKQHMIKRRDFMWISSKGMMMSGTNGSQLWDLAFIVHALVESGLSEKEENKESMLSALKWLDECQIQDNPKHFESAYRHRTKGAWPFSTKEQSYTVSDCTGEGLKAVLLLQNHVSYAPQLVPERRLCDAVDTMLTMQNSNGGFASYELIRGPKWLEWLNPAEVFGDIMIEYHYPECTTSVITSLAIFRQHYPNYRKADTDRTIRDAVKYVHSSQKPEGGWFGSWGICFTYATMFALESLSLVGETYENSQSVRRACDYLVSKQREDGGWGESYKACETGKWVDHEKTQVVATSWAAMALMYGQYPQPEPIERAVRMVMNRQLPDGSWAQEAIEGIFNKTCTITYPLYKFSFTIWMLGKAHKYLGRLKAQQKERLNGATNGNGHNRTH